MTFCNKHNYISIAIIIVVAWFLGACLAGQISSQVEPEPVVQLSADNGDQNYTTSMASHSVLDLNSDGITDLVSLVLNANNSDLATSRVLQSNLATSGDEIQPSRTDNKHTLLLIQLSDQDGHIDMESYVLRSGNRNALLNTVNDEDLSIVSREALLALHPELEASIVGDSLSILTEAGIDVFIFWNGTDFELFEPEELP